MPVGTLIKTLATMSSTALAYSGPRSLAENAIWAHVVSASQLPTRQVIWAEQGGPTPIFPMITLRVLTETQAGRDWLDVMDNPQSSGNDGLEIEHRSRGRRTNVIQIQCFTDDATGAGGAAAILSRMIARSTLPSLVERLQAAKIGHGAFGTVQRLGGVTQSQSIFEPRAIVEWTYFTHSEVSEFGTYIETVEVTDEIPDPDSVFTIPA